MLARGAHIGEFYRGSCSMLKELALLSGCKHAFSLWVSCAKKLTSNTPVLMLSGLGGTTSFGKPTQKIQYDKGFTNSYILQSQVAAWSLQCGFVWWYCCGRADEV
jgi:hypothetical protein